MSTNKQSLSFRLKTLGSDINTFWRPVRQKITDQMYDIALLQKFFKTWENSVAIDNKTNYEGYNDALKTLPKDNPDTALDEGISESQLKDKFQTFFNKPLEYSNYEEVQALKNQYNELKGKVIYYLAQQMSMDSTITSIQSEMDNLRNILKSDSSS